jgi:hypothetical protein
MNAPHLLLWFESGEPKTCELAEVPDGLIYKGKVFLAETDYFGDVDYLRDEQKRLVGFSYISGGKNEKTIWETLLTQSNDVKLDGGMLVILLQPRYQEVDCVQAMGTEIFRSAKNEIMILVPNWNFGELAFQLTTTDTPTAIPLNK